MPVSETIHLLPCTHYSTVRQLNTDGRWVCETCYNTPDKKMVDMIELHPHMLREWPKDKNKRPLDRPPGK